MSGDPRGPTEVIRFSVFEVDLRSGELRRNGVKVRLQDQPFRLLRILLENAGR
jgi:DNA-binding winged helix-turn-helix (wHTH) protein